MSSLLRPLTPFYWAGMRCHRFLSDKPFGKSYRLPRPVISVGNITWGGTGKTPLVLWLADLLHSQGKNPAILMRGFGKDEMKLYENQNYLLGVGRDRARSASKILQDSQPGCFILDDGFQHWPLHRDLDIVCINALDPFGNRSLIPAGSLREPLSGLGRADVIVLTNTNQITSNELEGLRFEIREINREVPIVEACHTPLGLYEGNNQLVQPEALGARPYFLVSGLGSPEGFYRSVKDFMGRGPNRRYQFKDHHAFTTRDLDAIFADAKKQNAICIVSEKDWVRSSKHFKDYDSVYVFKIKMTFSNGEEVITEAVQKLFSPTTGRVCILGDGKRGHEKQSVGLLSSLKRVVDSTEKISKLERDITAIRYSNKFRKSLLWLAAPFMALGWVPEGSFKSLKKFVTPETWERLQGLSRMDWVVSTGSSLLPIQLFLAKKFRARNIILMKPSGLYSRVKWDLVIQPIHDGLSTQPNIVSTLTALANTENELTDKDITRVREKLSLGETPGICFFVGGSAQGYPFSCDELEKCLEKIESAASELQLPIFITTSRRTPVDAIQLIQKFCKERSFCKWLVVPTQKDEPRVVETMLALSQTAIVTEESVSMISEALGSGRHVISLQVSDKKLTGKKKRFQEALEARGWLSSSRSDSLEEHLKKLQMKPLGESSQDDTVKIEGVLKTLV